MVIAASRRAAGSVFSAPARGIVLKSLGLTLLLFLGLWFGLYNFVSSFLLPFIDQWTWLVTSVLWFLGAGVVVGAGFLLGPTTALFAGLFLDEIAEHIEGHEYPNEPPGKAVSLGPSLFLAIKFGVFVLLANLLALLLVWIAGFGVIIFFLVNGYLLGQEYFRFAALRFHSEGFSKALGKKYSMEIFLSGLIIAGVMSIPLVNLLTPVFATTLMVHLHKSISSRQPE